MPLVVMHDCAKVVVGVANIYGGRIAALDADRWGSSRSGNRWRGWRAYLDGWCSIENTSKLIAIDAHARTVGLLNTKLLEITRVGREDFRCERIGENCAQWR